MQRHKQNTLFALNIPNILYVSVLSFCVHAHTRTDRMCTEMYFSYDIEENISPDSPNSICVRLITNLPIKFRPLLM